MATYYSCKSKRSGIFGEIISALVFALGLFLAALSCGDFSLSPLFGLSAAVVILLGSMLAVRYCFTFYVYTVDGDEFTVTEHRGRRACVVVRIRLSEIAGRRRCKRLSDGRAVKGTRTYDYRPSLFPREFLKLTLTEPHLCEGLDAVMILLSPDEKMLHILGA